jgi:hypothetical protein
MAERPTPALIKFVRRALRREPGLSFEQLLEHWRLQRGGAVEGDTALLRVVYDEEVVASRERRPAVRQPNHDRIVLLTVVGWFAAHLLLLAILGMPSYLECRGTPQPPRSLFLGCGVRLGLTALGIGGVQVPYGLIAGLSLRQPRPAVAQGILIGTGAVALLFTVLCFGAAGA